MNSFTPNPTKKQVKKSKLNQQRMDFLLSFFSLPHRYESKEINGFTLVRQFNGVSGNWQVAIYPPGQFSKVETWKRKTRGQSSLLDPATIEDQ